jgi:catechol 2,3-dioxygenase-like lactoylglutathione lyase family enzyme
MGLILHGITTLLEVFDVKQSLSFYCDMLGFQVVQSAGSGEYLGWAWLRHGDVDVMLNAMYEADEVPGIPDPARLAAHRDTTLFIGCADIDGAYAYLREKGVPVRPPVVAPYGMKQLSMNDPDGYSICLQWPAEQATS